MKESAERAAGAETYQRPSLLSSGLSGQYRGTPGTGSPLRWFFSGIWLVYLIQPVGDLFGRHHGVLWMAGGIAIAVVFCAIYIVLIGNRDRIPRLAGWCLAVLVALSVLSCVVYGQNWIVLWIYVSAATGFTITERRPAMLAVLGTTAGYALMSRVTHASLGNFLVTLLPVALIGIAMIGFRLQMRLMRELSQARETVVKLAANEERLRVTRDMHDLTGQSLSMITLKSDLARKILGRLPASGERSAVMSEMEDIGRVSRQSLHDIREALSGYRRPTLAIEIITARSALEAAGIALDDGPELTVRSGSFDPDAEAVLAWCLRESVTNVIRHSRARHCRIRLAWGDRELSLEVTDDGRGLEGAAGATGGSGLHGMSERLSAIGGSLSLGAPAGPGHPGRGLRLTATVPAAPDDSSAPRRGARSANVPM